MHVGNAAVDVRSMPQTAAKANQVVDISCFSTSTKDHSPEVGMAPRIRGPSRMRIAVAKGVCRDRSGGNSPGLSIIRKVSVNTGTDLLPPCRLIRFRLVALVFSEQSRILGEMLRESDSGPAFEGDSKRAGSIFR